MNDTKNTHSEFVLTIPKLTYDKSLGTILFSGPLTTPHLAELETEVKHFDLQSQHPLLFDLSKVTAIDTGGAWLLLKTIEELKKHHITVELTSISQEYQSLFHLIAERVEPQKTKAPTAERNWFEQIGSTAWELFKETQEFLAFIGQIHLSALRTLKQPKRFRWKAFMNSVQHAGLYAIPIIGLLNFLLGIVIAYQGGIQLQAYGANIFIVELVCLTMLRELAPMMTAIIIAGRTGSAYTAEIGTMKVTQEIDALRTLGVGPMEMLVLPKLFGLMIALPLLTMLADVFGIFGGMMMSFAMLDVSFYDFIDRIPRVPLIYSSFLIGIGKAPVFAIIVALMGCFQGFKVSGGAESVGYQTTTSVVQAIFLVIFADAAFSVLFGILKI